jgi:hypothetical protein
LRKKINKEKTTAFTDSGCEQAHGHAGMSKRTSYGKIHRPNVRFVRTSANIFRTFACVRIYTTDVFLPVDGFLPSVPKVKKCICADGPMRPHGHKRVRADQFFHLPTPRPPPRTPSLALHGRADASARTWHERSKRKKSFFFGSCLLEKKEEKNVRFSVFNP